MAEIIALCFAGLMAFLAMHPADPLFQTGSKWSLSVLLWFLWDVLVPRFLTEEVVLVEHGDHLVLSHPLACVLPGEVYDGIVTVRCFNLFGKALFPRLVGEVRPFVNPCEVKS